MALDNALNNTRKIFTRITTKNIFKSEKNNIIYPININKVSNNNYKRLYIMGGLEIHSNRNFGAIGK